MPLPGTPAAAQFVREEIAFRAEGAFCVVDALYEFRNARQHAALWPIFYPLLDTPEVPFADSIRVSDAETGEAVSFQRAASGISFPLAIPPLGTRLLRVNYRQRTPAGAMEYILTSTQRWDRPLERAVFRILIPDSLRLTFLSIPHDSLLQRSGKAEYLMIREHFMPRSNLVFRWERRHE